MLALRRHKAGRTLEPSAGAGAFVEALRKERADLVAIELDERWVGEGVQQMDFFDYSETEVFDCIIGNPPYVRYQDILPATKAKLSSTLFDQRTNLYLFFMEKSVRHLRQGGELIFITPRDFLKATSARRFNQWLYEQGTITDFIDLGDGHIFEQHTPNCVIFRFEKGDFSRRMSDGRRFDCQRGQLLFLPADSGEAAAAYTARLGDFFSVRVGAVSGMDKVFTHAQAGNADFVCSETQRTGKTRRMIFQTPHEALLPHKSELLARRIRTFNEENWWQWGRLHHASEQGRIYVNAKTRAEKPFFLHASTYYDGAVLALFPKSKDTTAQQLRQYCERLNAMDWRSLGFVCDGRFLFSQRSLENCPVGQQFGVF